MTTAQKPILALVGPTASGKSDIAFGLAQKYPLELVNIDSLQIYKHMDIGTAKPTQTELASCKHHLFNILNPDQNITALGYAQQAKTIITDIHQRQFIPLLVGGSGFYLQALSNNKTFKPGTLEDDSIENLYAFIQAKAPHIAQEIHVNDSYRVRRLAFLLKHDPDFSWESYTSVHYQHNIHSFVVQWPREQLYKRINARVIKMFEQGLLIETQNLLKNFPQCQPKLAKTIGYAQCLKHLNGDYSYEEAIVQTQQKTRNYAKRQSTWFKNRGQSQWFAYHEIFDKLELLIKGICSEHNIKG
ncbi:MAG TPA: tRNA (adenosine(37)-N6)-dimethylallyltransferase MiaA [Oligoflexia bacterium]|nr:tRNA (adenosine(37)-N6)-dimethylallyltransferase MiaA [Oligoflexia bacterium]HMR25374.1 tRNA (adenosine(37)-N6)-dimethylallyltransferase MiaA [Oligoflexia bacterium]